VVVSRVCLTQKEKHTCTSCAGGVRKVIVICPWFRVRDLGTRDPLAALTVCLLSVLVVVSVSFGVFVLCQRDMRTTGSVSVFLPASGPPSSWLCYLSTQMDLVPG